jgi:formylglycine-generating enzyme required for sulfatase activity
MIKNITILGIIFCSFFSLLKANNLSISNLSLTGQNAGSDYVMVRFDISWDNSWRTDNLNGDGVTNWDAAWLFVKYKKVSDGNWYHATLNTTNTNHSTGSQGSSATITQTDAVGVFFHRSGNGSGTFTSTGVQLRWQYGIDGLSDDLDADVSSIQVFGIEMVYVPQGAFYLGSGGSENYPFYKYPTTTNPYQVTSENALNVGQTTNYLWASNWAETGTIPADFPKGYKAFYCMKYEITQEQYADFLNTLTPTQQTNRFPNAFNSYRHYIKQVSGIYGCDANNNGVLNESNDGQNIACNYLSWADGCAYADWCGLRPMTELEFEKACRGTKAAVANEYAWGSTTITQATGIINSGTANETPSNSAANCVYNFNENVEGPMRAGCMTSGTRQSTGATYYGIMEMSGNLWERAVTVGNSTGRSFTGTNGNGTIDASGNANVTNWPGTDAVGSGFRGGNWIGNEIRCLVSDRVYAGSTDDGRRSDSGFRCLRSIAP